MIHRSIELAGNDSSDAWTARRFVEQIADSKVTPRVLADMQTVVTELVQVVLKPDAFEPIEVSVALGNRRNSVTVRCVAGRVSRLPRPYRWSRARLEERQLGLRIIHGLSDGVRLRRHGRTMSITAYFRNR